MYISESLFYASCMLSNEMFDFIRQYICPIVWNFFIDCKLATKSSNRLDHKDNTRITLSSVVTNFKSNNTIQAKQYQWTSHKILNELKTEKLFVYILNMIIHNNVSLTTTES